MRRRLRLTIALMGFFLQARAQPAGDAVDRATFQIAQAFQQAADVDAALDPPLKPIQGQSERKAKLELCAQDARRLRALALAGPIQDRQAFTSGLRETGDCLGMSGIDLNGILQRYSALSTEPGARRPGPVGANQQLIQSGQKAIGLVRTDSFGSPVAQDLGAGPTTTPSIKTFGPAAQEGTPLKASDFRPRPSVSDFASDYISGMGEYANGASDDLIAKRAKDPTNPLYAQQEHAQIMKRLVQYNTSAYDSRGGKVVMDAVVGTAATVAYNVPFGLFMGIKQEVTGQESDGLGLMGHWVVGLSEYVRGDKDSGRKHFAAGIADFNGDIEGSRAILTDDLEGTAPRPKK